MRTLRILTTAALIGTCALTASLGSNIIRFYVANAEVGADDNLSQTLRPWIDAPGLSFVARQAVLTTIPYANETKFRIQRGEAVSSLLVVKPIATGYWLGLAQMRFATEQNPTSVANALAMSVLTGPNEASMMSQRASFDVVYWELLPQEARRRAAVELSPPDLSPAEIVPVREALARKLDAVRQQIRAVFQAQGLSSVRLTELGL
jgi:hypothetical protein